MLHMPFPKNSSEWILTYDDDDDDYGPAKYSNKGLS